MARRRRRTRGPRLGGLVLLVLALLVTVALHRLGLLPSASDGPPAASGYDRDQWPHWIDDDGDCQDTRTEVLVAESLADVRFADTPHCKVQTGRWRCPYTGRTITDPREIDVDHLVPLSAAHRAGGHGWSRSRRRAFANALEDEDHLFAVDASANRSKGDKGPDRWLPPDPAHRCDYVRAWVRIKARWDLALTEPERSAVDDALGRCARGGIPARP